MDIIIDKEFQTMIPPLTEEEYNGLEQSILAEGCRDALVLWGNILVDGHNRYEICTNHDVPFETVQKDFADRNDALAWIIKNQFGRRNLPAYERAKLALRLKPVIAEKAKANQAVYYGNQHDGLSQKSVEVHKPIDTQKEIAKAAGVSHDTIAKVEKIEQQAAPEVKEQLRRGDMSINQAYKVIQQPHVAFNSGNNEWYTPEKYIELAREVLGGIDLDPASCELANETVRAERFFSAQEDGLKQLWSGRVWMNPPYSTELIGQFTDKFVEEYNAGNISEGIVLVNNATETMWFSQMMAAASAVVFPRGRIRYNSPTKDSSAPLQGQAFIYFGENYERFLDVFSAIGWGAVVHG